MLIADRIVRPVYPLSLANGLLLMGAAVLAFEPLLWLVGTWHREGYSGIGWLAFVAVVACVLLSVSSPKVADTNAGLAPIRAYGLLTITASLRLLSQILDINVVGALLLAVDVYALASLLGLAQRQRPVAPLALAVMFCFCLPIEPMLQRIVGYDLQRVSTWLACGMLSNVYDSLQCAQVRLQLQGHDVLVDLPCSGAQLMSVLGFLAAALCTLAPRNGRGQIIIAASFLLVGVVTNALRVSMLAMGIAHADDLGVDVMAPVPHTLVGLVTVAVACVLLMIVHRFCPAVEVEARPKSNSSEVSRSGRHPNMVSRSIAFMFFLFALVVGAIQPRPVDASPYVPPAEAPLAAAGLLRDISPLTAQEQRYFASFGGAASRASYGPYGLLLVSTASPLRHLHDPTICLTGMGMHVRLLGTDHQRGFTAYEASRDGASGEVEQYRVRVSYLSDRGELATSIAQVVWLWVRKPGARWTMIQRITPLHVNVDETESQAWESAMRRAFNIFVNQENAYVVS